MPFGYSNRNNRLKFQRTMSTPVLPQTNHKSFLANTLTRNFKRKKSYSCFEYMQDVSAAVKVKPEQNDVYYVVNSDDRANVNNNSSFSTNIWYYGQVNVGKFTEKKRYAFPVTRYKNNANTVSKPEAANTLLASFIVKIDCDGEFVYSLMYPTGGDVQTLNIPCINGLYCLNFADPKELRFRSVKKLLAHLIDCRYLKQVSFAWLLENSFA